MDSACCFRGLIFVFLFVGMGAAYGEDVRIEIDSDGWVLIGDLMTPESQPATAFALLLHKAAGGRQARPTPIAGLNPGRIGLLIRRKQEISWSW